MTTNVNTFNVLMLRAPLQQYFNSIWAYHLIDKLEYWFSHDKYHDSFYKFVEPCQKTKHFYKEGDSWTEVLGISRKVFNKTFDLIGIRYTSETAFRSEVDPFKGRLYASYHNRQTHQTFYVRNHHIVHDFLTRLCQKNKLKLNPSKQIKHSTIQISSSDSLPYQDHDQQYIPKVIQPVNEDSVSSINPPLTVSVQNSGNGTYGHSPTEPKGRSIYIQASTNNTSSIKTPSCQITSIAHSSPNQSEEDVKKMVDVWKQIVGHGYIPKLSLPVVKTLKDILKQFFDNCLNKWQAFCLKIASSKFLMGEKTSFKAWFSWVIKPDIIQRIIDNGFTFGDRQIKASQPTDQQLKLQAEQAVSRQLTDYAKKFHRHLLQQEGVDDYLKWFERLQVITDHQRQVIIKADNRFIRDILKNRFEPVIASAVQQAFGDNQTYQLSW